MTANRGEDSEIFGIVIRMRGRRKWMRGRRKIIW